MPAKCGVLAIVLLLGACGPSDQTPVARVDLELLDPAGQDVVFWYQHTREREDALLEMIAEYNRTNPHRIHVRGEYAGNYGDIYNKMLVALQGGSPPQLLVAYQNQALAYYQADGVVDLAPYMDSPRWGLTDEAREDIVPAFLAQDRRQGVQVGFPPNRSMEVLYYNADWLLELGAAGPPKTWDDFADLCRRAHAQPFSRSIDPERSLGFLLEADASRLASMVFSRGGDFVDATGSSYTLNTAETRASLTLMLGLAQEGAVEMLADVYGDQQEFAVGQILFALRSSSGLPNFKSAVEESGSGFEWGVTAPPHPGDTPAVNVYGASVSVCRTTPEQQLAAWLFVKWFTEPERQARWVRASNYFPARRSAAGSLGDYFEANPQYATAYGMLDYGRTEPALAGYQQVRRQIADAMVAVMDGSDLEKTLARLEREANKTIEPE